MIYILLPEVEAVWLPNFINALKKGFIELDVEYKEIKIHEVSGTPFSKKDAILLLDWRHIGHINLNIKPVLKVTHQHSTATIPTYFQNDFESEKGYTKRSDYLVMVNSDFTKRQMMKHFDPENEIGVAGFPLDLANYPKIDTTKKNPKLIVASGRLQGDKQFLLALTFLKKLVEKGYECIYSAGDNSYGREAYKNSKLENFERCGVKIQFNNQTDFYKLLAKASVYFNTSLPETLGLAGIEAKHYGCKVLLPSFPGDGFSEIVSGGYDPYSFKDLLEKIESRDEVIWDIDWLNYKEVARNYINSIKAAIGEK